MCFIELLSQLAIAYRLSHPKGRDSRDCRDQGGYISDGNLTKSDPDPLQMTDCWQQLLCFAMEISTLTLSGDLSQWRISLITGKGKNAWAKKIQTIPVTNCCKFLIFHCKLIEKMST